MAFRHIKNVVLCGEREMNYRVRRMVALQGTSENGDRVESPETYDASPKDAVVTEDEKRVSSPVSAKTGGSCPMKSADGNGYLFSWKNNHSIQV